MDVDKSLDDLISDKRQTRAPQKPRSQGQGQGGQGPRHSAGGGGGGGGRRESPYARPPPRSTEEKWVHDAYQGPGARRGAGGAGSGTNGPAGPGGQQHNGNGVGFTGVSPRIEVVGIHYEVTPQDLKGIFSQAGTLVQGPTIRYDRSGRSTGSATMEFASYQQAKVAINKFDGAMTKGQTISIRLLPPHRAAPRAGAAAAGPGAAVGAGSGAGAGAGANAGSSLLSRIGGGSLASRVAAAPVAGGGAGQQAQRGGARPAGRGRGSTPRGGRGGAAGGARKGPANAGDLDKELDSFMQNDKTGDVSMA